MNGPRRRAATGVLLALVVLLSSACAPPWASSPVRGDVVLHSPSCHCRFSYPASWYYEAANGDTSKPVLGLHNYNDSSAAHAPIPTDFADIGIDWQSDPIGQLYLETSLRPAPGMTRQSLNISGYPATAFIHWTAPPDQGGIYEEHVYLFVPWYQRDYDLSLTTANPPSNNVSAVKQVFTRFLNSLVIAPPSALA